MNISTIPYKEVNMVKYSIIKKVSDTLTITVNKDLGFSTACDWVGIYQRKAPGHYFIVNQETGEEFEA